MQGQPQRVVEAEGVARGRRHVPHDVVLAAHDLVPQRLGERAGDGRRDRCDQPDPVAGQPGGQHRHRQDQPSGQLGDAGVALHHLPVGQDVRAADVEGPGHLPRHGRAAHQGAQHVPHGDRLDAGVDPAGRDHDRQPFGEVAQHLEGRRPGADDDRRAQHGRGHAGGQQDAADLGPRAQVRRQFALRHPGRGQAAQVDDAPHACRGGALGEGARRPPVGRLEVVATTQRVHQVVGHIDALHRPRHRVGVGHVAPHHLGLAGPRMVAQPVRGAGQAPHPVSGVEQFGHETPPDVSGRAGDQAAQARPGTPAARAAGSFGCLAHGAPSLAGQSSP
ncbi:putative integral membrane protein [Streptomyces lividans 1326]|uniref:Putative integral membrane protein n=1 Tax=Streptomyces lividans 1326 TaxID=1200984 RepID=A0A7U9DKC8_STRLI|nr:putative integral membrane protein [Streptomyces lividans 1326]